MKLTDLPALLLFCFLFSIRFCTMFKKKKEGRAR